MPAATEFDDPNARDTEDEEPLEDAGITSEYEPEEFEDDD